MFALFAFENTFVDRVLGLAFEQQTIAAVHAVDVVAVETCHTCLEACMDVDSANRAGSLHRAITFVDVAKRRLVN